LGKIVDNILRNIAESSSSWVNFINILRKAFMRTDPKSAKKTESLTVFFALLGSACVKTTQKKLMKLNPSVPVKTYLKMVCSVVGYDIEAKPIFLNRFHLAG